MLPVPRALRIEAAVGLPSPTDTIFMHEHLLLILDRLGCLLLLTGLGILLLLVSGNIKSVPV